MSEDRPLDALFPELAAPYAPNDERAAAGEPASEPLVKPLLDTQVMETELEHAQRFGLAVWRAPEGQESLYQSARALLEVTLLQDLSRPPGWGGALERYLEGVDLFVFEQLDDRARQALERLGFEATRFDELEHANRLHAWQNVARQSRWEVPERPASLWYAPLRVDATSQLAATLRAAHQEIAERAGATLWGASPGAPSHLMASVLERTLKRSLNPTLESLMELDTLLIERATGRLRYIEPMLFQGLCDFIGVVMMATERARVQWGVCESDRRGGHLPPLLRLSGRGGARDVEVGSELLRHAILPRDEPPEALSQWFEMICST